MNKDIRVALTGFMGVGKSSVARHLSNLLRCRRLDLDHFIQEHEGRTIAEIIDSSGLAAYREIESKWLKEALERSDARIFSLGGGTWTEPANRELLKNRGFTSVWLEATFEHCWRNISASRKDRPLARDKQKTLQLFEERQKVYCLAEWHFVIRPDFTSYDVALRMRDEVFY
jgi:shikimate kinase